MAATLAATAHGLNPRKTFAARDHKLVFWLQPNFNATADQILEEQIRAYAKQAGVKDQELQILKVPGGEIATRMTAALEVGAPPDITRTSEFLLPRWKSQGHLLDITDIMGEMRQAAGGINPAVVPLTEEGGRNYAVPMGLSPIVFYGRMDLLEKAGYGAFPDTWDKLVEAGLKIQKPPLYAYGMALGTTLGYSDSTHEIIAILWAHGARLLDRGKPPGGELARGGQGLPAHPGHVPEAPDDPPGRPELGQLGEQQGLPGQAGGLRPRQPQHLLVTPHRRKELADRTGLFPAPGGPGGRPRSSSPTTTPCSRRAPIRRSPRG